MRQFRNAAVVLLLVSAAVATGCAAAPETTSAPAPASPAQPAPPGPAGPAPASTQPPFVATLIARFEAEPVANPPVSIWRYRWQDRDVYYVPPTCCDIPGELYAADGTKLCEPDGGFTGRGDGSCPDFHATRSDEERIWVDPR